MKKFIYTLIFAAAVTGFTSCSDLLEEQNYGNPTTEEMMANPENVVLLVGQAYADLKWVHDHWGYWGVSSLTADECVCPVRMPGGHWADGGYWENLNVHNWNAFADAFKNIWNSTISGAVLCNRLISTLNDYRNVIPAKAYTEYIAELEVLRAYYYYLLFDCFGRIPYQEDFAKNDRPLMEPHIVWTRLVAKLEENAPNMTDITTSSRSAAYGRVTKGFAYALLARLYLNAESFGCTATNLKNATELTGEERKKMPITYSSFDSEFYTANPQVTKIESSADFYTNVIRCCDEVKGYSIESDFFKNFKIKNEESLENIFVLVENGDAEFDMRYNGSMSNKLRLIALTLTYPMQTPWKLIEKPWNGFCARPKFLDLYYVENAIFSATDNGSDVRGPGNEGQGTNNTKQWGWFLGPVYAANGTTILTYADSGAPDLQANIVKSIGKSETELGDAQHNEGARLLKYEVDKTRTYAWAENDFVLMRYADVLWMKAEAEINLNGSISATTYNGADFQTMLNRSFAYAEDPAAAFKSAYGDIATWGKADILNERGREFAWEMVRRRDLIRFDEYGKIQYVTTDAAHRKWFPIPFSVLEKSLRDKYNNPYWTQTPGYN